MNKKRITFTLGIALALLTLGANFNATQAVTINTKIRVYAADADRWAYPEGNPTYLSLAYKAAILTQAVWRKYDANDGLLKVSNIYGTSYAVNYSTTYPSNGILTTSNFIPEDEDYYRASLDGELYFDIYVIVAYDGAKTIVPIVKQLVYGNDNVLKQTQLLDPAYAPNFYQNNSDYPYNPPLQVGDENNTDLFSPGYIDDLTDWTYGRREGIAIYHYAINITDIVNANAWGGSGGDRNQIIFDITTGDLNWDGTDPSGSALPGINHGLKFTTAESDITIDPAFQFNHTYYVAANGDYVFYIEGATDKDLVVSTSRDAIDKGDGFKLTKITAGQWKLVINKVNRNIDIALSYAAGNSSATGGETTGQIAPAQDAVWASGGVLYLQSAQPGKVSVYSITGQLALEKAVSGNTTINLNKGLYIVKLNGKAFKVIL